MKKIITLSLLAISVIGQAAPGYKITGNIKGKNDGKVFLITRENNKQVTKDSANIKAGKFEFASAKAQEPTAYYLNIPDAKIQQQFFLENGNIKVTGDISTIAADKTATMSSAGSVLSITGTPNNDALAEYNETLAPIQKESREISNKANEARKNKDSLAQESLMKEYQAVSKKQNAVRDAFIVKYSKQVFAAYLLENQVRGYNTTANQIDSLIKILDPSLSQSSYVKDFNERKAILSAIEPGKPAPEIVLPDKDGNSIALSSLKGKYVLIDFWASWCGPCRAEIPNLAKAYDKYKSKGFEIYGVSIDSKQADWEKALNQFKMTWIQVLDLSAAAGEVSKTYAIVGIPCTMLLDKDGKIIARNLRAEKLDEKLAEIFGE